ncbi:hypothetical protein ACHAXA_007603 [Cyclostephanos tholiformis]|uniref:Uncharacterized protein n=1 Tax=Cyclostephanos tholiformis TaxID=382380 RepID=A0ABD3REZ3_9STRA
MGIKNATFSQTAIILNALLLFGSENDHMPSYSLNTSWSDDYDADDGNSGKKSRANIKGNKKGGRSATTPYPTVTSRRGKLPQSEKKQSMENDKSAKKRMPVTASRMKLRSSSKKKNEEAVILRRFERVSSDDSTVLRKLNVHNNTRSPSKQQTTPAQVAPPAPYPPQPLKSPSKCPVSAIQLPLPFRLFGDKSNSHQLSDTFIDFREPLSYTESPPVSPGIFIGRKEHSDNNKQTMSLVDLDSPEKIPYAPYTSRKKLFAGKNCSPERSLDDPTKDEDAIADKRGEIQWLNLTQLSDELSRLNVKSTEAQYKAATNERYKSAVDDGEIAKKMEILLDLSYLKSRFHHMSPPLQSPHILRDITDGHRKRIILILDNPARAKILISIIVRNNKGIAAEELMRHFDYFSEN